MSDYNWCHGPKCHTYKTQSRIKGVGDNKVLRTRKIKINPNYRNYRSVYNYFCNQSCLRDFLATHTERIVALAPRHEPQETPINVVKEEREGWRGTYTETVITTV